MASRMASRYDVSVCVVVVMTAPRS
jgi:hypothetical protein